MKNGIIEKAKGIVNAEISQDQLRNNIADMVQEMGYSAAAREIRNNRNARDNAKMALKSFIGNTTSERINVSTGRTHIASAEAVQGAKMFESTFNKMIENFSSNSTWELKYFELKNAYINATWEFQEASNRLDETFYKDEINTESEEFLALNAAYEKALKEMKEAEDQLDNHVMSK